MINHQRDASHDHDVRGVEYSRVEWPGAEDEEVGDQPVPGNPVDEVARSTHPNECQADEVAEAKASADHDQVREQSGHAYAGNDRE